MLRLLLFVASFALLCTTSLVAFADEKAKLAEKKVEPESSPGWVVIEEDVWIRFIDEPSLRMRQAHERFTKKEYEAAAHDMRKAAGYLQVEAQNAATGTKAALMASAHELETLATETQTGKVKSVKNMEAAFARAEHALAADHLAKAKVALNNKNHAKTGHYLSSAVAHVESGAKWAGRELETGAMATANGVRTLSGKLIEGGGFAVDEAGKGVTWVGDEVEKLGKYIEPHKQIEPASKPVNIK
ncbi:hypothetical protein [Anatilimnocola floriformis]|uniref:hypothetical protein n=1 Tax=Anatilimnocola floriformis TaxID=2948575 RepID=UPI0020C59F14|nr:hypothetical protein [Anatilimnocola floriformis]